MPSADQPESRKPNAAGWRGWVHDNQVVLTLVLAVIGTVVVPLFIAFRPASPSATLAPSSASSSTPQVPSASSSSLLTETVVRPFRPYTDRGLAAQFKVETVVAGECLSTSGVTSDPQALRCDAEDSSIRDPCWANITLDQVVCVDAPWEPDVVIIEPVTVEEPIPELDPVEASPFALEILNPEGDHLGCVALSSFAGEVAGLRRNFDCYSMDTPIGNVVSDAAVVGSVFGEPDSSTPLWRVQFAAPDAAELVAVVVVTAWV